jgi:hypothetical protein
MGQFAADYRAQFGELPSKTLATRNGIGRVMIDQTKRKTK